MNDADDARRDWSQRMSAAVRDLQDREDAHETYSTAVELAVSNIDGCDVAGLSVVRRGGRVETLGRTAPAALSADQLQYHHGEGPCLDAIWHETTVHSPSLAYDHRWTRWGPDVVRETGLSSVLSFQLFTHDNTVGALNLYGYAKNAFSEEDHLDGLEFAAHVAVAIVAAQQHEHLLTAIGSRTVIGQATGRIMERYGLTADRAFASLTRISSTSNIKIRDLAQDVVTTGHIPGTDPAAERSRSLPPAP